MASVQNCLSAAKYLKMATPILSDMGFGTMTVHSEMFEIISVKGTRPGLYSISRIFSSPPRL